MQETMKAVVAQSQGKLGIVCVPVPVPGEYECLTKITYCGICNGTDLKLLNNQVTDKTIEYPTVLGHEAVGYIVGCRQPRAQLESRQTALFLPLALLRQPLACA